MKKAASTSSALSHQTFTRAVMSNGAVKNATDEPGEEPIWYMEPVRLDAQMQKQHKYQGCKGAGCRTFKDCICSCKDCTRWCKYRGVTICDEDGTVFIRFANGKLIVFMPREEYDNIKVHWEKLGLKLEPPSPVEAPADGVTPG